MNKRIRQLIFLSLAMTCFVIFKPATQEVLNNPVFARIIGTDYQGVSQIFDNHFLEVFEELQTTFKV